VETGGWTKRCWKRRERLRYGQSESNWVAGLLAHKAGESSEHMNTHKV
jgi:hypothetical protein